MKNENEPQDGSRTDSRSLLLGEERSPHCLLFPLACFLSRRWTVDVIWILGGGRVMRFGELRRTVKGSVSPRVLSSTLRTLEELGVLRRVDLSAGRLHVEYALTREGVELLEALRLSERFAARIAVIRTFTHRLTRSSSLPGGSV